MNNKTPIKVFSGENVFLSNFYNCSVLYDGFTYKSAEAAFHAQKTLDAKTKFKFTELNASESKKLGHNIQLRLDWEEIKVKKMRGILLAKFSQNLKLKEMLLLTKDRKLIEGNWWGDTFWGVCKGVGKNMLGKLLMEVRDELEG